MVLVCLIANFKRQNSCRASVLSNLISHACLTYVFPQTDLSYRAFMHQRGALLSSLTAVGMKILLDNTILYRYINKALHSFRLLEISHPNIFFRGTFP